MATALQKIIFVAFIENFSSAEKTIESLIIAPTPGVTSHYEKMRKPYNEHNAKLNIST